MSVLHKIHSTLSKPCCDTPCCTPYRTESVGVAVREGFSTPGAWHSGQVPRCAATVLGVDIQTDPERDRVMVFEHHESATHFVVLVIAEVFHESGGKVVAERLAADWRERLGFVGPEWVRREAAAEQLGVGVKMVDKLRRAGRLRGRRVPVTNRAYVHRDDVTALAAERAAAALVAEEG